MFEIHLNLQSDEAKTGGVFMAIYKCKICGAIYDEAKEGKPISELENCPVCKLPVSNMVRIDAADEAEIPKSYSGKLDYDSATARHDPSCRYRPQRRCPCRTGTTFFCLVRS